ncbi:hypothetical protein GCM10011534_32870 [Pseudooceanicola nanhaiensis]|uniref:Caspase family p20 domain-containing protein n=1 Tax=Pseudooceanicola nanhaiensis TaxID=375761 RepID=A0A917T2Y2_9RHOB|nr:caspase family protein [Pseudooceanicola nanhaiensis]GGM08324.1 hypothetical protein GCM10011534_32870 [Pseudooceanicola nanhaiensis]
MRLAFVVMMLLASALPARAVERVALVIGNGNYGAVSPLDNATRDAALLAGTLRPLGFDVTLVENATRDELIRAVAEFGRRLRVAGPETVGLFYYAGHGVQSFGANYLLPVDTELTVAADLDLVGLEAASVLRQMASARNRINIVILDACRNNPFEDIPDMDDNGLAEMKAPTGTFLAYATAPGAVALDGTGDNSPFTAALADAMQTEDLPIEQMFKAVRVEVIRQTGGAQTPWDTSSLTQDFVFKAGEELSPEAFAEEQLWKSVAPTRDSVQIMLFLRSYPDGRKAEEARALLKEVMAEELSAPAAPQPAAPAPVAPAASEAELMEAARAAGTPEGYRAYLDAYPEGVFAELVKIELAALETRTGQAATPPAAAAPEAPAEPSVPDIFFDRPLSLGSPQMIGRTITEITQGTPLYPPIEGLPDSAWKDQSCSGCHQWTREALCDQGQTYVSDAGSRALQKEHPMGGTFKRVLRQWAAGGCR